MAKSRRNRGLKKRIKQRRALIAELALQFMNLTEVEARRLVGRLLTLEAFLNIVLCEPNKNTRLELNTADEFLSLILKLGGKDDL